MKNIIKILLIAILATSSLYAQKVKLKKDKILIDGTEVFSYKLNQSKAWLSIYELNTNNELIFIKEATNGTYNYRNDDYTIYKFLEQDIIVEISTYTFWKSHIKFLLENKVFDVNGNLNITEIELLKTKFDENITERTIKN